MIIETKYKIGDMVFFIADSKIRKGKITGIQDNTYEYGAEIVTKESYGITFTDAPAIWRNSDEVFPTKEKLLASL